MKIKRILVLLTFIFGFFLQQSIIAHANDTSHIKLTVTTDKKIYTEKDEIAYKLTILNTSSSMAKDVVVTSTIPEGMEVTSTDSKVNGNKITWNLESVNPSSEVQLGFKAKIKGNKSVVTSPIWTNVNNDIGGHSTAVPKTGDTTNFLGYFLLLIISFLILFASVRALLKKRITREVSFLLIFAMMIPSFTVAKAEGQKETVENTYKLIINNKEYVMATTVEALMDVKESNPSEQRITVTGEASDAYGHFIMDKELTFTSSENDIQVVRTDNEGYFVVRLQQGEKYTVTGVGIKSLITAVGLNDIQIQTTLGNISLGKTLTNGSNKSVLQPGSILLGEVQTEQIEEVAEDLSKVIFKGDIQLKQGDVFLIPQLEGYPTGIALKVASVTSQGNQTVVLTSEPELKEVFSSIKGNTSVELSPEYFIPEPGVTVGVPVPRIQSRAFTGKMNTLAAIERTTSIPLFDLLPDSSPIEINGSLEISGKVTGAVDWAWEADLVDSWDFKFEGSQIIKGEIAGDGDADFSKRLGKFRIPTTIPGLAVSLPVNLVGGMEGQFGIQVETGMKEEIGVKYTDRDGVKVYPEDHVQPVFSVSDLTGSGDASLGVKLSVLAEFATIDFVGVAGEGGIAAEASAYIAGPSGCFKCANIETKFYGKFSLEAPILDDWTYDLHEVSKALAEYEFGSCVRSIKANSSEIEIAPGESKKLLVKAISGAGEVDVATDDAISYSASDPSIITVEKDRDHNNANIIAAPSAQDGDTATVNITYKVNGKEFKDQVRVTVIDARERGTLEGKVVDAVNTNPLLGASVKIYNGTRLMKDVQTIEDGTYDVSLIPGTYKIIVSYPDYITDTSNVTINAANTTTYDSKLQMVGNEYGGIGTASGKITNALTGQPTSGLNLVFRNGRNNLSGEIVKTLSTNEQGGYTVDLPGGNYTMEIDHSGYITTSANIVVLGGLTRGEQNATISPEGVLGEGIRVVLNWGASPSDLDSHFTGPTVNGSRFHVYYSSESYRDSENDVYLDVDDTSSYGPETVTVLKRVNEGTYTYAIHNFSDRSSSNLNLSNSDATVRLYSGNLLLATYNVPLDKQGNVWRVFEIRNGMIVPINRIDYISDWQSASDFAPEAQ
jgi:uncharacterized repeat protein (TIGR01451 family)